MLKTSFDTFANLRFLSYQAARLMSPDVELTCRPPDVLSSSCRALFHGRGDHVHQPDLDQHHAEAVRGVLHAAAVRLRALHGVEVCTFI